MKPTGIVWEEIVQFSGNKKEPPCGGSKFDVPEQIFLSPVYDVFHLSDGHIKFFCQRFITASIDQPSFKNLSVPLRMNVLIDQLPDLAVRVFRHSALPL